MKNKSVINIVLLLVVFLFWTIDAEAQCAMCRAVLESQEDNSAAKGINNGIMYLMAFPYLLVGGIGVAIYRHRKKSRKEEAEQED
ncbi:MAG TPA: hypothetical protein VKX30_04580 [Flavobacteriaceae bacterium]|nr:hypothetical protein [Flavobacteriaceae bacterium]